MERSLSPTIKSEVDVDKMNSFAALGQQEHNLSRTEGCNLVDINQGESKAGESVAHHRNIYFTYADEIKGVSQSASSAAAAGTVNRLLGTHGDVLRALRIRKIVTNVQGVKCRDEHAGKAAVHSARSTANQLAQR